MYAHDWRQSLTWGRCLNPLGQAAGLWRARELIGQMTRREVAGRYRGSVLGASWGVVQPLLMLAIYSVVFTSIFNARWGGEGAGDSRAYFALALFAGLIGFGVFAEVATRAPTLVISHANLVKKVVFPLQILPVTVALSACVHSLLNVVILLAGVLLLDGRLPVGMWFLPLAYVPLVLLALSVGWLLSAVGVYLRDTASVMPAVVQMLMFLTPIFYPASVAPAGLRVVLNSHPLSVVVEGFRFALLPGAELDAARWSLWTAGLAAAAVLCHGVFLRLRRGFADAL